MFVKIKINEWEKFNPRSDVKKPSWFRLDNSLIEDPRFYFLSGDEFKALIYIFSLASKRNSDVVDVFLDHAHRVCNINKDALTTVIEKLKQYQIVTVVTLRPRTRTYRARNVDVTSSHATLQDTTGQDTTEHDKTLPTNIVDAPATSAGRFDFESVAKLYPNNKGRSEGVKRLGALIKTESEFSDFKKSVENYAEQIRLDKTEPKFIKYFSSFVGSKKSGHPWVDWVSHVPTRSRIKNNPPPLASERVENLDCAVFGG